MNQPPTNPGTTPIPTQLLRRRKAQYKLRRRAFTFEPEPVENETKGMESDETSRAIRKALVESQMNGARQRSKLSALTLALAERTAEVEVRDAKLQAAQHTLDHMKAQVQRANGEMEQLRKRQKKEKEDLQKFAAEDVVRTMFPVLDNFAIAAQMITGGRDISHVGPGVLMVQRDLSAILESQGLTVIDALFKPFDPQWHEAATTCEDPKHPNGIVMGVLRLGYALRGKVLRPAMVTVNRIVPQATPPPDDEPVLPPPPPLDPLAQAQRLTETKF